MRYQYTISHVAEKDLCMEDTLSRAPIDNKDTQANQFQHEGTAYINLAIDSLPATKTKIQEIKEKQEQDLVCQQIKSYYL